MTKRNFIKKALWGIVGSTLFPAMIVSAPEKKKKPKVSDAQRVNMAFGHGLYPSAFNQINGGSIS